MSTTEFTTELKGIVQAGVEQGIARQGKGFLFVRPEGRTAEEGLMLPELVFQALGAAVAEGIAARDSDDAVDYSNVIDIGHQLLAHIADQARPR